MADKNSDETARRNDSFEDFLRLICNKSANNDSVWNCGWSYVISICDSDGQVL